MGMICLIYDQDLTPVTVKYFSPNPAVLTDNILLFYVFV